MTKKQIPDFKTIDEMARFFDNVDTTELDLEDVDFVFSRAKDIVPDGRVQKKRKRSLRSS